MRKFYAAACPLPLHAETAEPILYGDCLRPQEEHKAAFNLKVTAQRSDKGYFIYKNNNLHRLRRGRKLVQNINNTITCNL